MNKFHFKTSPYLFQHTKKPSTPENLISKSLATALEKDKPSTMSPDIFPAI